MKLRPANFLRSSSDQAPLVSSEAKRAGYLDTSSRPTGVLKIHQWTAQQILKGLLRYFYRKEFLLEF